MFRKILVGIMVFAMVTIFTGTAVAQSQTQGLEVNVVPMSAVIVAPDPLVWADIPAGASGVQISPNFTTQVIIHRVTTAPATLVAEYTTPMISGTDVIPGSDLGFFYVSSTGGVGWNISDPLVDPPVTLLTTTETDFDYTATYALKFWNGYPIGNYVGLMTYTLTIP